ncbi:MAG TPA: ATP-binding protein, partial [Luteitalea sp.]|nr:ATP-binding protein [Luteitalea sp.]
ACGSHGYPDTFEPPPVPLSSGHGVARAFREDRHIYGPDAIGRPTIASVALLVLRASSGPIGVLALNFASAAAFTERDRVFLEALAAECAQSLERADLYEREKHARAEAEEASRVKDELLATLSHELRTPVNAILGWTQLLRQQVLPAHENDRALETIERNARLQARLVEELLDMSRIVSGKLQLNVHQVYLGPLVAEVVAGARPSADAKRIHVQLYVDPNVGPVLGDADRLMQVVWNLVANAVKFTPKGGQIEIKVDQVASSARIVVADNGRGIAPDVLPFIFDRFRQAGPRTDGGLGLGLAIVRHVVEAHGGVVSADSEGVGRGALLAIKLPLAAVSPADPAPSILPTAAVFAPRLDDMRILLVEDESDSREIESRLLESYGAEVQAFGTAVEAFDAYVTSTHDVMIADIGLPEEDGYSLMRRIRAIEKATFPARVPAIALTAFATADARKAAMLAGFNIHVAKPVEIGELVAIVFGLSGRSPNDDEQPGDLPHA